MLSTLLEIDVVEVEKLIREQFKGKDKLIEPNLHALHSGCRYAQEHLAASANCTCAGPSRSASAS